MAVAAVTFTGTRVAPAEALSETGANWYDLNGKSAVLDPDLVYQGTRSVTDKVGTSEMGVGALMTSSVDFSTSPGKVLLVKAIASNVGSLNVRGASGAIVEIGSGAFRAAYYRYYVHGKETWPPRTSWLVLAIDPKQIPYRDAMVSSPALNAITYLGFGCTFSASSKSENVGLDAIDWLTYGQGLRVTGGTSPDAAASFLSFSAFEEDDSTQRHGIITSIEGVLYVAGMLTLGNGATAVRFAAENRTVVFPDYRVDKGFCGLNIDLTSASSAVALTNCALIGRGADRFEYWPIGTSLQIVIRLDTRPDYLSVAGSGVASFNGVTLNVFRLLQLRSGFTLNTCILLGGHQVSQNAASLSACSIAAHTNDRLADTGSLVLDAVSLINQYQLTSTGSSPPSLLTGDTVSNNLYGGGLEGAGQSFTSPRTGPVAYATMKFGRTGSPYGYLVMRVYETAGLTGSLPAGLPVAESVPIRALDVTVSTGTLQSVPFRWSKTLIGGGVYVLTMERVAGYLFGDASNYITVRSSTAGGIAGQLCTSTDGVTWTLGAANADLLFEIIVGDSMLARGFKVGQQIVASGFTNAANNGVKTIAAVDDLSVRVSETLVDETGSGDERLLSIPAGFIQSDDPSKIAGCDFDAGAADVVLTGWMGGTSLRDLGDQATHTYQEIGQTFGSSHVVGTLVGLSFELYKVGAPPGNVIVNLYQADNYGTSEKPYGSVLASGSVAASSLPTSAGGLVQVALTDGFVMKPFRRYVAAVQYDGGDGSNYVVAQYVSSGVLHPGVLVARAGTTWSAFSASDLNFSVTLECPSTGHAIEVTAAGTYTFSNNTFVGYGPEGSSGAAALNSVSATVVDSYAASNYDGGEGIYGGSSAGQVFSSGAGGVLSRVRFLLGRLQAPTGPAYAKLYASDGGSPPKGTGAALAVSEPIYVEQLVADASISAATPLTDFEFRDEVTLAPATDYVVVVEFAGGDLTTNLRIYYDTSSPTHAKNFVRRNSAGVWSADAAKDAVFAVHVGGIVRLNATNVCEATYRHDVAVKGATIVKVTKTVKVTVVDHDNDPIEGVQTAVYQAADDVQLMNKDTDVNGEASVEFAYPGSPVPVYIRLRKSSTGTRYVPLGTVAVIGTSGLDVTLPMSVDPNA